MNAKIEIKEMPKMDLAYVSSIGPENLEDAFCKLQKWATPKELLKNGKSQVVLIYHDSFKITEADKVRMSACIILNEPIGVSDGIGLTSIEGGKYIVENLK